ncbi:MAG: hypothetical protein EPO28_08340 [Saprospiraceae bacterium]|nr:MAG: hypothetical protein EPO28_08340 [Saprospiraceae bacterium]
MKNIAAVLMLTLPFFSCKKEDPALFIIPIQNLSFAVDATIQPPFTYYIPINNVLTNAQNVLQGHGLDASKVHRIRPHRATLSVVFAESDLNFIDAVSVRLCPLGNNEENCGQEVFYRDPVPFNPGYELDLVPSNVNDVQDFVLPDQINVQVKLERLRGFPEHSFDIRLDMEFEVR